MKKRLAKDCFFFIIGSTDFYKLKKYRGELGFEENRGGGVTSIKKAFTLVEMLIVVVIIGILAAAILPRITGYLAKTRDLKRHVDLRNLAVAIERYRDDHGDFPQRVTLDPRYSEKVWGSLIGRKNHRILVGDFLLDYLSDIPKDPNPLQVIQLHFNFVNQKAGHSHFWGERPTGTCDKGRLKGSCWKHPKEGLVLNYNTLLGHYLYQIVRKAGNPLGAVLLVAKVETPEAANYVRIKKELGLDGGTWGQSFPLANAFSKSNLDIDQLKLCTSVKKSPEEKYEIKSDGTVECSTNSDQLYYIVKIE